MKTMDDSKVDYGIGCMDDMPSNKFSRGVLKTIVGEARANQVLTSMSMAIIPGGTGSMRQDDMKFSSK